MPSNAGEADNKVEERIVAAKFDASDFEKGVNKTIKKLDELNEKLDFKKTGESVADLSKKATEAQDKATKSIEKLTDRYTTFIGQIKQKLISGLADQVVEVFFRMEKAALSFAKSMSFDQISAGFQKYQDALTSVRMIVNSYKTVKNEITGLTEKIHYTQDEAYSAIKNLQDYADETSYSMGQMTDAMSKMVAAGVTLEQAEKNVQGIANACAAAGVNAQEASRAFYNLSQAYSSGSLKYTDYRSLELLNMTNENFQNQLLAAGVKAGTLKEKKDSKGNITYVTKKSKTNGKVTAGKKVTKKGLTDSLRYGWADNDVMDALFGGNYFVDVEDFYAAKEATEGMTGNAKEVTKARKEFLMSLKDYDTVEKKIKEFTDKDSPLKGQLDSFSKDADARKKQIDGLLETIEGINKASKKYGEIQDSDLLKYLDKLEDDDARKKKYKSLKTDKERKAYLQDLKKDADIMENVEGKVIGYSEESLQKYIESLDESNAIRKKYDDLSADAKKKYLKQLADESKALDGIGKKYSEISVEAFLAAREARNLSDVINAIGDFVSSKWNKVFENLIGKLDDAAGFFTALSEGGIAEIFTGFAEWVANASDAFNNGGVGSENFRNSILLLDSAIGNLFGMFQDLLPSSEEFGKTMLEISRSMIHALKSFEEWTEKVRFWLTEPERVERIQKIFANLSGVFAILGKVAGIAFNAIGTALTTISPLVDALITAFGKLTEPIGRLGAKETTEPFDKLQESIDNIFIVLDPLIKKLTPAIEFLGNLIGIIGDFFLQGVIDTVIMNISLVSDALGFLIELFTNEEGSAQAKKGQGVIEGIRNDIVALGDSCKSAMTFVTEFFGNLFKDLRTLFGLEQEENAKTVDGGLFANIQNFLDTSEFLKNAQEWIAKAKEDISKWFNTAVSDIQTWFANLPKTINDKIHEVLFKKVGAEGEDKDKETKESAEDTTNTLYDWLTGVKTNLEAWFTKAKEDLTKWFSELPGKISEFFTGFFYTNAGWYKDSKTGEKHDVLIETPLKQWLDGAIESVSTFIANLPSKILSVIGKGFDFIGTVIDTIFGVSEDTNADKKTDPNANKTAENVFLNWARVFVEKAKTTIKGLPDQIKTFFAETKAKFKKSLETIKTWFKESETGKQVAEWGQSIITGIKTFILSIPERIKNIIKGIGSLGRDIISTFKEIFTGQDVGKEIQNGMEEQVNQISISGILNSIADIGQTLINQILSWFTGTEDVEYNFDWFITKITNFITGIPGKIWKAIEGIGEDFSKCWSYFISQFKAENKDVDAVNGETPEAMFEAAHPRLAALIKGAAQWIEALPETFTTLWDTASQEVGKVFGNISKYWSNLGRLREIDDELANLIPGRDDDKIRALLQEKQGLTQENKVSEKNNPFIANVVNLVDSAIEWIKSVPNLLVAAWNDATTRIGGFFSGIGEYWTKMGEYRKATKEEQEYSDYRDPRRKAKAKEAQDIADNYLHPFEEQYPFISNFIQSLSNWVDQLPGMISEAWENAKKNVTTTFTEFVDFWKDPSLWASGNEDVSERTPTEFEEKFPLIAGWVIAARRWIESIPGTLETAWKKALTEINGLFSGISSYWRRLDAIRDIQKQLNDPSLTPGGRAELEEQLALYNQPSDFQQNHPFISSLVGSINGLVNDIPGLVSDAFTNAKTSLGKFWDDLVAAFNGENLDQDKDEASMTLGEKIRDRIVTFFANVPKYITDGIKMALDAMQGALTGLTGLLSGAAAEDITADMLNKEEVIGKNASEALKEMDKATETVVEESPSQGFLNGIIGIGQKFWSIITTTIPDFIKSGFAYIGEHWRDVWWPAIKSMFTGGGNGSEGLTNKEAEEVVKPLGDRIKEAIESLPETIKAAWDKANVEVARLLGLNGKPLEQYMIDALANDAIPDSNKEVLKQIWKRRGYDVPGLEDGVTDWIEGIGAKMGKVIGSVIENIGPMVVQGWSNTIDIFDKVFTAVTKFFTGGSAEEGIEDVGDAIGAEFSKDGKKELGKVLGDLWKKIEDFILDTVPGFIGSTIAKLVYDVPKFFTNLLDGFTKTTEELAKSEETADKAEESSNAIATFFKGIFENLSSVFGSVVNIFFNEDGTLTAIGTIISIVGALGLLVSTIGDVVQKFKSSKAEGFDEKNNFISAFKFLTVFADIALVISAYAANLEEDKYKQFLELFDKIEHFVYRILDFLTIMTLITKGPELIRTLIEGGEFIKDSIGSIFDFIGGGIGGIIETIAPNAADAEKHPHLAKFIEMLKGDEEDAKEATDITLRTANQAKKWADAEKKSAEAQAELEKEKRKSTLFGGIENLLELGEKIGDSVTEFGGTILKGGGAAIFTTLVGTATSDIFSQFIGNFGQVTSELDLFIQSLDTTVGNITDLKDRIDSAVGIFESVTSLLGYIITIQSYKDKIPDATSVMQQLATPLNTLLVAFKGNVHAAELVKALEDIMGMTGKMTEFAGFINGEDSVFSDFKWAIMSLGSVISIFDTAAFANGIPALSDESIGNIVSAVTRLLNKENGIVGLMSEITPDKLGVSESDVSSGASMLLVFATALKRLSEGANGFDETIRSNLVEFFGTITDIAREVVFDDNTVTFAAQMETLGSGLASFAHSVKSDLLTDEDIRLATSALNMVADLSEKMSHIGTTIWDKITTGGTSLPQFSSEMADIGKHLQAFMGYMHPVAKEGEDAAKDWDLTAVSTAMYALIQLANAAGRISTSNVDALKSLLSEGGSIGTDILNFMKNILGVYIVYDTELGGVKMPAFTYDSLNLDGVINILDAFNRFSDALSKLGTIDVYETLLNLTGKTKAGSTTTYRQLVEEGTNKYITLSYVAESIYNAFKKMSDKMSLGEVDISQVNTFISVFRSFIEAIYSGYSSLDMVDADTKIAISISDMMTNIITATTILNDESDKLFSIIDTMGTYDNEDKLEKAQKVFNVIKTIGEVLSLFGGSLYKNTWSNSSGLANTTVENTKLIYSGVAESITELQTLAQNSELLVNVVDALFANINAALDTTEAVQSANEVGAKTAKLLLDGIQSAFDTKTDEELPHIRVVLDDNSVREQMASLFGMEATQEFNISAGFAEAVQQAFGGSETFMSMNANIEAIKTDINTYLQPIQQGVADLQGEMTQVQNAIASMGVYLDRGTLVGELTPGITMEQQRYLDMYAGHVVDFGPVTINV